MTPASPASSRRTSGCWRSGGRIGSNADCCRSASRRRSCARRSARAAAAARAEAARALLQRRFPVLEDDPRELKRAIGVLVRKGYDSELAWDLVRAHARGGGFD